jgi:hypothetical protein
MAIQRISEIEGEPVIGKFYLVPCVETIWNTFLPVIGSPHDDTAIIGISGEHYHFDTRFLTNSQITGITRDSSIERKNVIGSVFWTKGYFSEARRSGTVYKRLKCLRQPFEFPLVTPDGHPIRWIPALEAAYKDVKLSDCLKCPHRGIPLKGLPQKGGVVKCPGHGLAWNIKTGEMVNRLSK